MCFEASLPHCSHCCCWAHTQWNADDDDAVAVAAFGADYARADGAGMLLWRVGGDGDDGDGDAGDWIRTHWRQRDRAVGKSDAAAVAVD